MTFDLSGLKSGFMFTPFYQPVCRGDLHCWVFRWWCFMEQQGNCTLLHEGIIRERRGGKEQKEPESLVKVR